MTIPTGQHVDSRPMKVEVKQAELADARRRPGRGRPASRAASCRRRSPPPPGADDAKGGFKKLSLLRPDGSAPVLVVGLGKREEVDAERLRVAAALAAKEAGRLEASSIAWALPERDDAEAARGGAGHRHDPRRLPLRPLQVRRRATTRRRLESLTLLGAGRARRRPPRPPASPPRPRTGPATCRARPPTSPPRASSPRAPRRSPPAHDALSVEVLGRDRARGEGDGRPARRQPGRRRRSRG